MTKKKNELTREQIEKIVEQYIGVHPKYLQPMGTKIRVLVNQFELEKGKKFKGFPTGKFPAEIG